jgi:CheY-like chemotaxis protein
VLTSTVDESLAALAHDDFVFSLLDVSLNCVDGTELLRRLKIQGGNPGPIILLAVPAAPARLRRAGLGLTAGGTGDMRWGSGGGGR